MPNNNLDVLFPGHKKRWIRVLVKKKQREESVQMKLDLFDDLPSVNDSLSKKITRKAKLKKSTVEENSSEQLALNLFKAELES